jgi:hypothetical protein
LGRLPVRRALHRRRTPDRLASSLVYAVREHRADRAAERDRDVGIPKASVIARTEKSDGGDGPGRRGEPGVDRRESGGTPPGVPQIRPAEEATVVGSPLFAGSESSAADAAPAPEDHGHVVVSPAEVARGMAWSPWSPGKERELP